jgi:hypothetical protein
MWLENCQPGRISQLENLHGFHGGLQKNYVETKPKEHISMDVSLILTTS